MKNIYLLLILFLGTYKALTAQNLKVSVNSIYATYQKECIEHNDSEAKKKINFYKKYFSKQISASCEFHNTCSSFTNDAIKRQGFGKGFLLGIDRLTRCGASQTTYNYLPSLRLKNDFLLIDELHFYE